MNEEARTRAIAHYRAILEDIYGNKPWILAKGILANMTGTVSVLHELGATKMLCIAAARGTGPMPDEALAPDPIALDVRGDTLMTSLRNGMDALANLSEEHVARIDAFDPEHQARAIGTLFDDGRPVGGRAKFGRRRAEWIALEDKLVVDAIWDACDVPRAETAIVDATPEALLAAAKSLDQGLGTVWAGDNKEGYHGGSEYLRWVRREEDREEALAFFAAHCDRVRVMPFLEGIPCSMHGFVFDHEVVALRPCEMLVMRRPDSNKLHYSSAATYWDPPEEDREQMRGMIREVGAWLRREVGYRGAFTIDGIMSAQGFRPTELNPRFGAALRVVANSVKELPLMLLHLAMIEHPELDWRPALLEELLLTSADSSRAGGAIAIPDKRTEETSYLDLRWAGDHFDALDTIPDSGKAALEADARCMLGPSPSGSFMSIRFNPETTPVGESLAPRVVAAIEAADAHFDLEIGALEPALDVRRDT